MRCVLFGKVLSHFCAQRLTGTPSEPFRFLGTKDGENGLLVGYNDKEAIKGAILKLYKDRELAARLGAKSAADAKQYSVEAMMDKLVKIVL